MHKTSSSKRFAIAVSFSGEHRAFVLEVVECLAEVLGKDRVFYDEWYEGELVGKSGDLKLRRYYRELSQLVVPFFSEHYKKPWCKIEWHAIRAMLKDRNTDDDVVPVAMDDTIIEGWESIDFAIRLKSRKAKAIADCIIEAYYHRYPDAENLVAPVENSSRPNAADSNSSSIAISRLLDLGVTQRFDSLIGREKEIDLLTQSWQNPSNRVLIFVAEGGVGKTSLVADWLMEFINKDWQGVKAFFDWSFYSQGTRDQTAANSGLFFDKALRHFNQKELADSSASIEDKADRLAQCLAKGPSLLLLDGVEPLQHPVKEGGLSGHFKDTGIQRLLKCLAQMPDFNGLCIITTRVPLSDLKRFHSSTVQEVILAHLSPLAAAQVMHQAGACRAGNGRIAPGDKELLQAAKEIKGHALTCQLLGAYLKHAHSGDIRKRDQVDWPDVFNEEQEGHAWAVMQAYEHWFEQHGKTGQQQLAVLRLLGFFDRPASYDLLQALRQESIRTLNEPLIGLNDKDWNKLIQSLLEHRLLTSEQGCLDAHPLLREYFAVQLQTENIEAWQKGHQCLYQYLCKNTGHQPDTLEGLQPLYQAVAHGCQAGLHQEVRADVYRDRILRGTKNDGFYTIKKLGAFAADLGAVACFFDHPWQDLSSNLSVEAQAWLLNMSAILLRGLGRLGEALQPIRTGLNIDIEREDWKNAAISASNLSELELSLGELKGAVADAEQSVSFADLSQDDFQRMGKRTTLADTLHQAGRDNEAQELFEQAEIIQAKRQLPYPRLSSLPGFRYCDLLLSRVEQAAWKQQLATVAQIGGGQDLLKVCEQVCKRATEALKIAEQNNWLLDIGLDNLTLGRIALYQGLLTKAFDPDQSPAATTQLSSKHLIAATGALRKAGQMDDLPKGLLSQAWLQYIQTDSSAAITTLNEAWEISERGPMPLYLTDILLTRARLFGSRNNQAPYPWDSSPQKDLIQARKLIQKHGYHRRDQELLDAERFLSCDGVLKK